MDLDHLLKYTHKDEKSSSVSMDFGVKGNILLDIGIFNHIKILVGSLVDDCPLK